MKMRPLLKFSLLVKSFFAIIETAGGIIFYFISQDFIINFIFIITRDELSEDPKDFIAGHLIDLSHNLLLSTQHFISIYLLFHGIVKMIAIIGLLKNKLWSFPFSISVFTLFIVYQVYRYFFSYSVWLLVLTVFDIFVVLLIYREYMIIGNNKRKI
jgi:uncharacterized membrane protein